MPATRTRSSTTAAPPAGAYPERLPPRRRRGRRTARSLAAYLAMIFVLITLNFLIPRAMPGDPIQGLVGQASSNFTFGDDTRTALRRYYNLDGSLVDQYGNYLRRLARGDLGRSIATNAPVSREIGRRVPWTVLLIASSTLLANLVGVAAGVHSGWRRDGPMDRRMMTGLLTIQQMPAYLLGPILLFLFAVKLGWFPLAGAREPFSDALGPAATVLDIGRHLVLPLVVLTAAIAADSFLVMRSGMVTELGSDHLRLGRAKGLRDRRLKYRYAARNALLPVVALVAVDIGFAVAANVVVERIFAYPGLGELLFLSIGSRDYPVIQGVFLVLSIGIVSVNALADAVYRRLDPRTTA